MKKILVSVFVLIVSAACLLAQNLGAQPGEKISMKVGSRTFEIQLENNQVAKEFVKFASDKDLKMQKYGGFEFYVYQRLNAGNEQKTSKYEKGKIYYNTTYNAISFAYADHDLGKAEAVLIGSFTDTSAGDYLKTLNSDIIFSFSR